MSESVTKDWTRDPNVISDNGDWWRSLPDPPTKTVRDDFLSHHLRAHNASIAILSRAASCLYILSAPEEDLIVTAYRIPGPMGLSLASNRLAIGCATDIRTYVNIESDPRRAAFIPTSVHFTGAISVHDVAWGTESQLFITNTLFSNICSVEPGIGFREIWRPSFILDEPVKDACHLNGMIIEDNKPMFATALAATATTEGWRHSPADKGILIDEHGKVAASNLSLPHSPTLWGRAILALEAGRGRLLKLDGSLDVLWHAPSVLRGLAPSSQTLFIGASPVRNNGSATAELLKSRFPSQQGSIIFAVDASGQELAKLPLPFIPEISSIHTLPYSEVLLIQPSPEQRFSTYAFHKSCK